MRNVPRLLLVALLLVLGAMMTSCGGAEAPEPTEAPKATEAPKPTEKPEEPTEAPEEEPTEEPAPEPTEVPVDSGGLEEITVAYFLEWPTANQVAQLEETYDEVMGVKVNWVS
ncbi:MAG: hypothetical protein ACPGWR_16950, partial [Ardenticatenaceae bacterium]